jgi:hypothetical protein
MRTQEFVKRLFAKGKTFREISEQLDIPSQTFGEWRDVKNNRSPAFSRLASTDQSN